MKKIVAIALSLVLTLSLAGVALAEPIIDSLPVVSVTGTATVRVAPDIAVVYLGVSETNEAISYAQSTVNQKIAAIVKALKEGGVEEKDIATENYSIYPEYTYNYETNAEEFKGFTANCQLAVTVRAIDTAGVLIDNAFQAGANRLNSFEYSVQDGQEAKDEALTLAVEDAMRKADVIAKAAGQKLGSIKAIQDNTSVSTYYTDGVRYSKAAMETSSDAGTQLMGGMLDMTATVTIEYHLN